MDLLEDIFDRIRGVEMSGSTCTLSGEEFLVCRNARFRDCVMGIRVWASGTHVTVSWQLACRPGWFKRLYIEAVTGDQYALSLPRGAHRLQEFVSWHEIIHHCVAAAVRQLENELKGSFEVRRERIDVFDDW